MPIGRSPSYPGSKVAAAWAGAALALALAGCVTDSAMQRRLESHLATSADGKPFSLVYDIGSSFSGETHFSLQSDGSYSLWSTVTEGRARLEFNGRLPASEVRALLTSLSQSHFWRGATPPKANVPADDVQARISLKDEEAEEEVAVWLSEMGDHPGFQSAQRSLLALIARLSGGKILENGQ